MMMKQNNWMPLHIGDYLRDTGHLTTCEHGAYFLLLCHAWTHDGVLPNDEARLLNIAKMDVRPWRRSSATLRAFFYVDGDTLRHRRVDRELAKSKDISDRRSAAGKASAVAREAQQKANKRSTSVDVLLQQNATQEQEQEQEQIESESELRGKEGLEGKPPPEPKPVRARARTQIDPDWKPNAAGLAYAKARNVPLGEVQAFVDYHRARGNLMADWDAAWRTWCNNSIKFGKAAPLFNPRDDQPRMTGGF